ncbi:signal transducer and activator of transcription 5A-like, partial [Contarinia nasturtii]|uniref:signal transducer and activator of transcription 5A-like n=1 Tax=Contarinia nasturtii TaxID=265458 RepID=UPI0012D39164
MRIKVETKCYENMLNSFSTYRTENNEKYQRQRRLPINFEFEKLYLRYMEECRCQMEKIEQLRSYIFEAIEIVLNLFVEIHQFVIDDLNKWKYEAQKLANEISYPVKVHNPDKLDAIQIWLNKLYECLMDIRSIVENIHNSNVQMKIVDRRDDKIKEKISNSLQNLIASSFIIEKHPSQIIKRDTRNNACVRMLITEFTKITEKLGVSVSILSESKAVIQRQQKAPLSESSGCIADNTEEIQFSPDSDTLRWNFKRMMVTKVTRKSKSGSTKDVSDKKFVFVFRMKFQINDIPID